MPRWTCREPALITSIGSRRASATATPVLPTPVGPAITTRRGFTCPAIDPSVRVLPAPRRASAPAARLVLPTAFQLAPDVTERHAAHDRPPVRAAVGCVRRAELRHEPLHLLAR